MAVEKVKSGEIEAAIKSLGGRFTIQQLRKKFGPGRQPDLLERLERFIAGDNELFHDEKFNCCRKDDFFADREFLITPDEWEISQGFLIPGHRFVPMLSEEVFPSEVKLNHKGIPSLLREIHVPIGQIFRYCMLLGSEQVFDFLAAESSANRGLKKMHDLATITVYDLQEFYQSNNFQNGDALKCRVVDYAKGVVEFSCLSHNQRNAEKRRKWIEDLDSALVKVCEKFEDYLDIPEQLAWGFFYGGTNLYNPEVSMDEFIAGSSEVEIRADGDHAVLSIRQRETPATLPEGLSLAGENLDDPLTILATAGSPLGMAELEGYMLDAIYGRESDFDGVYSRAFGHAELDFNDEAQQAVLLNFLEERFEELRDNYNRYDDEPKATLRSSIMEVIDDRLEFFSMLGTLEGEPGEEEHKLLHKLAVVGGKLAEVLKMLNNPAFTPSEMELNQLAELAEQQFDEQDKLISSFNR